VPTGFHPVATGSIPGAPVLSIGNVLGASMLLQMSNLFLLKYDTSNKEIQPWGKIAWELIGKLYLLPAFMLFFGWLYHMWFMR